MPSTTTDPKGSDAMAIGTTEQLPAANLRKPSFRANRRRVPTVLQMEAVECGAAALTMILAFYGRWEPLEKVRVACNVTRDGADALNIVRAARQFGLVAKGMRGEIGDLGRLTLPAIAYYNFSHFVVVEGGTRKGVWVNDPAGGPILIPWRDFDLSFTGVTLVFEPGPDFERCGHRPSLVAALASRLRGARAALALCLLAGIGLIIPGLALPVILRVFVDRLVTPGGGGSRSSVAILVVALFAAAVVSAGLSWIQQLTLVRLATKLAISMSTRFFDHLLKLPIEFFQQRYAGTLVTRTNVNDQVAMLLSSQFAGAMLQMLTVVFYAGLMVVYSPSLAVATIGFGTLNLVVLRVVARRRTDANRRLVLDTAKMTSTAMGGLQNIETVKAIGEEGGLFARWSGQQAKVANARAEIGPPTVLMDALPTWLLGLNTIFIVGFGGWRVLQGSLSLGTLVAFQVLAANFAAPIAQLVGLGGTIQEMTGQIASVDDVLNYQLDDEMSLPATAPTLASGPTAAELVAVDAAPPVTLGPVEVAGSVDLPAAEAGGEVAAFIETVARITGPDAPAGGPPPAVTGPGPETLVVAPRRGRLSGLVELRHVTFGYDRARPPLIEDFSLVVRPGERVAIIGASGSGKSTVAKLVCGLYRPWSGQILFDNIPRNQVDRRVLASSLALVDQEIVLFEGTVRDNLTLWDPTVRQPSVVAAARDAGIHRDIVERPGGFDRAVEEAGRDWSGGQRQRLEIARALATDPSVVVLDEATSALDAIVEAEIDGNLRGRGCSCIIVAHRLSTIRDADEILVMESGRVGERGTHDDLVAAGGLYAELVGE